MLTRIAWIGPTDGCFDWMLRRLRAAGVVEIAVQRRFDLLPLRNDFERIVLACRNRIDYPWREIQQLQEESIVAPWALAVDNWWDGARRTGIGAAGHLVLPWYRWWDGWYAWFFPRIDSQRHIAARLFSPVHVPQDLVLSDSVDPATPVYKHLIVVAGCQQTAISWLGQARVVGMTGEFIQPDVVHGKPTCGHEALRVRTSGIVLLDDTCVGTFPGESFAKRVGDVVHACCIKWPGCRLIIAASFPRWDDWLLWQSCGAMELIAKPTIGLSLARIG